MDNKEKDLEQILNDYENTSQPDDAAPKEPEKKFVHMDNGQMPMQKEASAQASQRSTYDDTTKIRRMSDSTRARELAASRSKRGRKQSRKKTKPVQDYTYEKERPDGEYLYTQVHGAKQMQKRKKIKREPGLTAAGTETLRLNVQDIVNMTRPLDDPVQPGDVEPAPRARKTSTEQHRTAGELDVRIKRTKEEAEAENKRRQEMLDKMELDNAADIRQDIDELRSAISFRILALFAVLVLSSILILPISYAQNMNLLVKALVQLLLGAAACVVCTPVLRNGLQRLIQFQADTDSLAAVSLVSCMGMMIINVVTAIVWQSCRPYYLPCIALTLLMHSLGKMLIISREQMNLHIVTKRFNCFGLNIIEDEQHADGLARGIVTDFPIMAAMHRVDSLVNFRRYTYAADIADRFCRYAAPLTTIFALAASAALTALRAETFAYGLMLFTMFTTISSCAAITFVANLPLFRATRKMSPNGALMLGYQSVDDFYDTNSLLLDASALFPGNSVKIAGIQMFSSLRMDDPLRCAASLAWYAGSALKTALVDVLPSVNKGLYPVENYAYEDSLGLSGWIHNQRILMGNRELMTSHHIEGLPSLAREAELTGVNQEAVYLSVSGNLVAMFLIELQADEKVQFWMQQCTQHDICIILRSVDPMISLNKLTRLFDMPREMMKIIPARMHSDYFAETKPMEHMSASMACSGTFAGAAQLLIGSKILRKQAVYGIFVQAVTILLGLGLVLLEGVLKLGMTPGKMLLMQLIVSVVTLIAVSVHHVD